MKKLISFIIISLIGFSSTSHVFAIENEGFIERTLELRTGIEGFNIQRAQIDDFTFISPAIENVYADFKTADRLLREEILQQYAVGNLEYNQVNGMIENHAKFVYYTNRLFLYLHMKETGQASGKELDNAIINSYTQLRSYYTRLKAIANQ